MKKTTLALIFLLKLFSLHTYFVQTKRSICDVDFIKHLKKTCETFTGRGPRSIQEPQPLVGRTISGRGPQFAHPWYRPFITHCLVTSFHTLLMMTGMCSTEKLPITKNISDLIFLLYLLYSHIYTVALPGILIGGEGPNFIV